MDELANFRPPVYEKDMEESFWLMEQLCLLVTTKSLSTKEIKTLADAMQGVEYGDGEVIIRYGDIGKEYFLLRQGEVTVVLYHNGTDPKDPYLDSKIKLEKTLTEGGFGEMALLYGDKRSATIKAKGNVICYRLDDKTFKSVIVKSSSNKKKQENLELLDEFDIFKDLDYYNKTKIGDSIKKELRKPKDIIIRQGDEADFFYVIKKGEVVVKIKGEEKPSKLF